ncbi:MAG: TonB-dependent receptor [Filimonas sp.]|nr:TonB-dependent receptor [Filimonas sp.]
MKLIKQTVLAVFTLLSLSAFGQSPLKGKVYRDENRSLPVAGATVSCENKTVVTDSTGSFYFPAVQLPASVTVTHLSLATNSVRIKKGEDLSNIAIIMNDDYQSLNQVVVTAGRFNQRLRDVPQKIEVLSAKDINSTPSLDMTDVLKKNTTVNVIQYPGLLAGIGIRGFRPQFSGLNQRTLLLVNGRPAGATNMSFLDLNNVDRIEVFKGPASALYGSQAMGGVVNIITPQSSGKIRGTVNASYGSFNTYVFNGKVGGDLGKKFDFDITGGYFKRADDFKIGNGNVFRKMLNADVAKQVYSVRRGSALVDSLGSTADVAGDGKTRPNTKYSYYTGFARVGYKISNNWRVDVSGSSFTAKHVESPGDIAKDGADAGLKNVYRYSGDVSLSGNVKNHELLFRSYLSFERSDALAIRTSTGVVIDTPYLSRRSDYKWNGFQARDAIRLGDQKIIVGYDYSYAFGKLTVYPAPKDRQQSEYTTAPNSSLVTHGFYTQGQLLFLNNALHVNPGIRIDNTTFNILETPGFTSGLKTGSQSNVFVSPSISAQYDLTKELSVHGSLGRAFVTPDASNVAGTTIQGKGTGKITLTQGNPDLKNENSWSQDIGARFAHNGWFADVTYFATQVKDRITSKAAPPADPTMTIDGDKVTSITTYYNSDNSYVKGLEVMVSYDFGVLAHYRYSLRPFINATYYFRYEDTKANDNGGIDKSLMTNIAKNNYLGGVEFGYKKLNLKLSTRYVGKRWDRNYNDGLRPLIEYPSFMTMDFFAAYKITAMHQLAFYLDNLTDENYYEKRGYNMPGRNFRIKYTLSF